MNTTARLTSHSALRLRATMSALRRGLVFAPILGAFIAVAVATSSAPTPVADESLYLRFAENLTRGYYAEDDNPNLWFGPGLPIVLVPFAALDAPLTIVRLLGPVFLFLGAVMFSKVVELYATRGWAIVGAYSFALYPPFYRLLPHLHTEPLAIFALVTGIYFTARYLRDGRSTSLVFASVALAWLALTRVAFGWVLTLLLVAWTVAYFVSRQRLGAKRLVAVHAIALAACTPWLLYTYAVAERPFYWGTSGGQSLYWMSTPHDDELGDWHEPREVRTNRNLREHREFFRRLDGLTWVEQDEALRRRALENIRAHPMKYAENVAANVGRMWFSTPFSFREQKISTLFYIVSNALLLGSLALALVVLARVRRLPLELPAFSLLALVALAFHTLLSAYPRMLAPLVPIFLWLILYAFARHVVVLRDGKD